MIWNIVGSTLGFMVVGYLFGSISNAIIVTKIFNLEDIRTKGSGNAGATNILRNYGWKIALLVFILDILKVIIPILIAFVFFKNLVWLPLVGFAGVIGHILPLYFRFQGGKGAASFLGLLFMVSWPSAIGGFLVFMTIVLVTRYVSLGSICAILSTTIFYLIFALLNLRTSTWEPITSYLPWYINFGALFATWILILIKHKSNIIRLWQKTESKLKI